MSSPVVALYLLPTADVPLPLGSRTVPIPQLPAALQQSSSSFTHSASRSTPLHCTALHKKIWLQLHRMHAEYPDQRWTHLWYWRRIPKFSVGAPPGSVSGKLSSRWGGFPQIPSAAGSAGSAVFGPFGGLSQQYFSTLWKQAAIVNVLNNTTVPRLATTNQLSLLNYFSKLFEFVIHAHVSHYLRSKVSPYQHCFTKSKSTITKLVNYLGFISPLVGFQGQADITSFDLSNAFYTVPHSLLLHKLSAFELSGGYVSWFCNYLPNQKSEVRVSGVLSFPSEVLSGALSPSPSFFPPSHALCAFATCWEPLLHLPYFFFWAPVSSVCGHLQFRIWFLEREVKFMWD
jgi:hypothetical protein